MKLAKSKIFLISSAILFTLSLFYLLFMLFNKPEPLNSTENQMVKFSLNEYIYYDITEKDAFFYINLDSMPVEIESQELNCSDKNDKVVSYLPNSENVYHMKNLSANTEYRCIFVFLAEGKKIEKEVGYFKTVSNDYLKIESLSYDAYDVGFNVVFRANWESIEKEFLITKTLVGANNQIIEQEEFIVQRTNYVDNKVSVNGNYVFEVRAIQGNRIGQPIIVKFQVNSGERIEDGKATDSKTMRILDSSYVEGKIDKSNLTRVLDSNDILLNDYQIFIGFIEGVAILTKNISGYTGYLVGGDIVDGAFVEKSIYYLDDTSDNYILKASLEGKVLSLTGLGELPQNIKYFTPQNIIRTATLDKGRAILDNEYRFIILQTTYGNIKVYQREEEPTILYDPASRKLSWNNSHGSSYLLKISNSKNVIYQVLVDAPEYILDRELTSDIITVEVLEYSTVGVVSLATETIELEAAYLTPISDFALTKLGNDLELSWTGGGDLVSIEMREKDGRFWKAIVASETNRNYYLLKNVSSLKSGSYILRINTTNTSSSSLSIVSDCYISVNNGKDYRILCD